MGEGAARYAARLPALRTLLITRTRVEELDYRYSQYEPQVLEHCLMAFVAKWGELRVLRRREGASLAALQRLELYHCDTTPAVVAAMVGAQSE